MSCYEWERGEIKLPTAEFARVRQAVEKADRAAKEASFALTQDFWKGLTRKQQTDPEAYRLALLAWERQHLQGGRPYVGFGSPAEREHREAEADAHAQARDLLSRRIRVDYENGKPTGHGSPKRVLQADVDYPTNRTTTFACDGDATIEFDRATSTVTWGVSENNHAVESAHARPLAQVLFGELAKVRWTRGTGGVLSGNDEYNAGSRDPGGGANYVTCGFGPVGAADWDAWMKTSDYRDSTGTLVRRDSFPGKKGWERQVRATYGGRGGQGRVPRGVRAGGQFAGTYRGESGVRLR